MCDPSSSPPILKCSPLGIYAPNPSFNTLAKRLYQLMVTVIRSKRVIQRSTRLNDTANHFAFMSDESLPVAPVFRNVDLPNDTIEDMEQAQHDALVTYFGLCLFAGSYETSAIHEDILPTALKRSSMNNNNPINDDDVMQSWADKVQCVKEALEGRQVMINGQDPSTWVPKVVYTAQGEILTQYYSFALVKGPLSNERIDDAKKQALCTLIELNRVVVHDSNPYAILMDHDDDEQLSTDFPNSDSCDDALSDDVMQKEDEDQESPKDEGSPVFSTATAATEETTPAMDDKQSLPDTTPPSSPKSTTSTLPLPPQQQSSAPTKNATSSWANVAGLQRDKPVKPIKKREPPPQPSSTKAAEVTPTPLPPATGAKGKLKSAKCIYYHFHNGKCRFNETQCHYAHEDLSKLDTCEVWRRSPDACEKGDKCVYLHKHQPQQKTPKNDLTKTRLCYDYMNSKCAFTEAKCKYAHEDTSRVPVCPDWNGIAGSCKKYDGWCNLLHPAPTKKATNKEVPGDGEDLFPALSSEVTEAAENGPPGTPKPSAAATTSYADTVKREAPPQPPNSPPMRAAPPSPASSHATQVSMTIYDETKRKTQLCKYYKKGTCKFSTEEQCHFAHEDTGFVGVCPLYKEGKCKKEDECTFLHGLPKDDCRRKTKLCEAYLNNECPFDEDRCDYAHEDASKVPLCHYALSGLCISDPCCFRHIDPNDNDITTNDMIQFQLDPVALHDQSIFPCLPGGNQSMVESLSIPSFVDEALYSDAAKKPPKIPERGNEIQKRDPVDEEAIRQESLRYTKMCKRYWGGDAECFYGENCWFAHEDTSKVRTCYFWIQGHCISEKECPLKHPAREDDGYVPLHQNTSRNNGDDMDKKTRKCWFFWYYEGCRNDPCNFAHEDLTDVGVCYYWQHNKKCPWDPACPYLHSDEILGLQADDDEEEEESPPSTPEPSMNVNEHDPKDVFAKLPSRYDMLTNTVTLQRLRLANKFRSKPSEDVVPRVSSGFENNEARYREHRREAFENAEKMIRATQNAQQARNCNEVTEAEEHERDARYYAKQMKAEHAKASQKIFEECNRGNPRKKYIDLHGQHVDEALQYIQRWFAEFQDQRNIVYIITGAGRHSRGIKGGKLRPAVEEYLSSRYMMRECSVHDDCTNSGGIYAVWYCVHKFVSSPTRTCVFCSFKQVQ